MKPESTKATGRVKSPIRISAPPTSSRMPATPISEKMAGASGKYSEGGKREEFLRAVLDEEQRCHDPEKTARA